MLINVAAMLIVIVGLFYFGRYMDRLISHEVESLMRQAQLVASTLAETAVSNTAEGDLLEPEPTLHIVRRLVKTSDVRVQVFTPALVLAADSRLLRGSRRYVHIEELPAPDQAQENGELHTWRARFDAALDWASGVIPVSHSLSRYPENDSNPNPARMPDLTAALRGESHYTLWTRENGGFVITVAVPVQRFQQIVGVILLTRGSNEIAAAVHDLRMEILNSFAVVLVISGLLSIYLAQTIARPLKRLSRAALRARAISGGPPRIPDFSRRGDEIGALSLAIRSMTDALWQRLDAIERFAADVSHELKNPITSMKSALETLARVTDPEQKERLLSIVGEDVQRMDRLVTDIAHASRLEAELSRAEAEQVNLIGLLSALVSSRNQIADETGPRLDLKVDQAKIHVRGVPGRLVQVFENMISNALSFTPPGRPVVLRAMVRGAKALVTVEDEGPGIPADKIEKIFERFYSARPAGERFGTHSGLGLSISRQIVEGHGGRIYAENREPHGAKFTVELPVIS